MFEKFVDHYCRPNDCLKNSQNTSPEACCLNDKIDNCSNKAQTVHSSCRCTLIHFVFHYVKFLGYSQVRCKSKNNIDTWNNFSRKLNFQEIFYKDTQFWLRKEHEQGQNSRPRPLFFLFRTSIIHSGS